ncbi:unnamed protein product [Rhizoctonia solani]|uniref:Uncharacterized protein n=1 Tax=Rhizoctonia solani TaxID=456999 RepID=A0A8H3B2W8_9AGAM|nr:unnamed protein product [Rhizoctonia solani]
MAQTRSRNKRSVSRKAPIKIEPKKDDSDTPTFPEYIEHKDGLYRCLLCKDHTLERYMWLGWYGMKQHQKRGTRHKQLVRRWRAARNELKEAQNKRDRSELSLLAGMGGSEATEEQAEFENSTPVGDPDSSLGPVVEYETPALYYPTASWDEPVQQGVRVVFDDLESIGRESEPPVPQTVNSGMDEESSKSDDKLPQNFVCEYGSTKINGCYTCNWCHLPYTPQRKYRRCKRATSARCEEPAELIRDDSPLLDHPSLKYPDVEDSEPDQLRLHYVLDYE